MRSSLFSFALILVLFIGSARAFADDGLDDSLLAITGAPADRLLGHYGFNWLSNPTTEICTRLDAPAIGDLNANWECGRRDETNSASGKPHARCTKSDKTEELIIFATKSMCDEERLLEAANGD